MGESTADRSGSYGRRGIDRAWGLRLELKLGELRHIRKLGLSDAAVLRRRLRHRAGQQHDQVLGRHRGRLPPANPSITVNVQTVDWTDFPNKVADAGAEQAVPGHPRGRHRRRSSRRATCSTRTADVLSPPCCSNLMPTFLKDGQYQGTDYGIPFTTSTRALYYNKKIFAAAHLSSPPPTWAQLRSDAAAIKAKGYIGYGMPLGSEEAQAEALLWFLGNGGGYVDAAGKYAINSAAERADPAVHEPAGQGG